MRISIFASIGSQNLGDELILKNEIKLLEEKYSKNLNIPKNNIFFSVFTYDKNDIFYKAKNVEYIEYFPIGFKKIKNIFKNIFNFFKFILVVIKSDLIVVGGGGIFYDNEYQSVGNPLKQWNFRTNIFRLLKKKIEFFRVGINIKKDVNLYYISNIFSGAEKISVRDEYSFNLLSKLGFSKNLFLENDSVFFNRIDFSDKKNKNLDEKKFINKKYLKNIIKADDFSLIKIEELQENKKLYIRLKGKKIGFALRELDIKNYKENIIEIINFFIKKEAEVILIPHSFHKIDKKANDFLFLESIKKEMDLDEIHICKNMGESYEIYKDKKIDFNFASRLHSIILSQVYEIPFVGISYSTKTDEVLKMLK